MPLPALPRVYTLTLKLNSSKLLFIVGQWPATTLLTSNFLGLKSPPQFPLPLDAQFFLARRVGTHSLPEHKRRTRAKRKAAGRAPAHTSLSAIFKFQYRIP